MKHLYKFLRYVLVFGLIIVLFRYSFLIIFIWGLIEMIIWSIKEVSIAKTREFICNFVITVLNCVDILSNIVLQIPANRILLTTNKSNHKFGNPKDSFTRVLRLNFIYGTLKPRGLALQKIINFFKRLLS